MPWTWLAVKEKLYVWNRCLSLPASVQDVLLFVPLFDRLQGRFADLLRVLGQVPLFFWLLHVPLIHGVAVALSLVRYGARCGASMRG